MYIVFGNLHDPFCRRISDHLEAQHFPTITISNPLLHPFRFEWQLDNEQSVSRISRGRKISISDDQIEGVFVRNTCWIDPAGWEQEDLAYMQSEMYAGLLAWLWSLKCPVVNRFPAAIWYRARMPLLFWQPLLRSCGLRSPDTLITNVSTELKSFRQELTSRGFDGGVYSALTSDVQYLVTNNEEWNGLRLMQERTPVCMTSPHDAAEFVSVIGNRVVWNNVSSLQECIPESSLIAFAKKAGLAFVELAFANTHNGPCVIAIDPYPKFEHFNNTAVYEITEHIVALLTSGKIENTVQHQKIIL
jgi:hypothetical protein